MLLKYLFNIYSFIQNMTHIAKIIEIVGSSDKSWKDAAQGALSEATKTIHFSDLSDMIRIDLKI